MLFGVIMTTLKRHAILIACLAIVVILAASMAWHCTHGAAKSGTSLAPVPANSATPTDTATATTDWTLIGQAVGALIAGAVGVWQLIRKKDIAGAVTAGSQLITDAEKFRETLKAGSPLSTTETVLAAQLSVFMGHSEVSEIHRALAKDLLTKYVITVRP